MMVTNSGEHTFQWCIRKWRNSRQSLIVTNLWTLRSTICGHIQSSVTKVNWYGSEKMMMEWLDFDSIRLQEMFRKAVDSQSLMVVSSHLCPVIQLVETAIQLVTSNHQQPSCYLAVEQGSSSGGWLESHTAFSMATNRCSSISKASRLWEEWYLPWKCTTGSNKFAPTNPLEMGKLLIDSIVTCLISWRIESMP